MRLQKLFLIAIKDLKLIFRDPTALVFMLLAPFALTLGMGALTGRFSGSTNSGIQQIPMAIVNNDSGLLGKMLVDTYQSPELASLVAPQITQDLPAAKSAVDNNKSAAVIYIPAGFSDSIIPSSASSGFSKAVQIEFYANPTQPTNTGVLRSILDQFIDQVEIGRVAGVVTVTQLLERGIINLDQASALGTSVGQEMAQAGTGKSSIKLNRETAASEGIPFDVLAYMAPGMAMMFLMFTVTYGGRSLLAENRQGTLPRMLIAPVQPALVVGGKALGVYLTALAQLTILIGGTSLLFRLQWGDTLGVILLILTAAFAATGWGMFFAAVLKTPAQVSNIGMSLMLVFGLLGGSFFDLSMLPSWVNVLNKITPNSWANSAFETLSTGGKLTHILPNIFALLVMGTLLFGIAVFFIRKRGLAGR